MRNLARALLRLLRRDDRGAIGVVIAILMGGGVLLGMGALTIDVGQIYQNRAELQNGADAAALAIATQCAHGACPANPLNTAITYASDNASALTQFAAGVDCVYGSDGLSGGTCPADVASGNGLTNCPKDPPVGTHFVDVQTETGTSSTLLPPVFAETLVGGSTYNGTTVKACAQAEWGPLGGVGLTISGCEWGVATGGTGSPVTAGNRYWSQPGTPDPSYDTQFLMHQGDPTPDTTCVDGPAGHDAPGAFGWTADPTGLCVTVVSSNTYGANPGNSASGDCQTALTQAQQSKTPVSVPVYASVTGTGNNTVYTLLGYASFVITGFHVPGDTVNDWLNPSMLCGPPDTCVDGYLTTNTLSPNPANGLGAPPKLTG